jgi:glycerophosphoryl diester phosphodiesterase
VGDERAGVLPPPGGALAVAHRAGNDLALLAAAETLGVDVIEADLHLCDGRIEVRHLRTAGPLPVLWDRWRVQPAWRPRLRLETLLAAAGRTGDLMLDLKGTDRSLPHRLIEILEAGEHGREAIVCSRNWPLLEPFAETRHRVVCSIGDRRELTRFLAGWAPEAQGVSINHELVTATLAARLRARAPLVMAWTVNAAARMEPLLDWGVNAIISDNLALLTTLMDRQGAGTRATG